MQSWGWPSCSRPSTLRTLCRTAALSVSTVMPLDTGVEHAGWKGGQGCSGGKRMLCQLSCMTLRG